MITAPANGSTVSGTLTVTTSASDASGVSRVDFWIDRMLKGSDTTSPYTYVWDTTAATKVSNLDKGAAGVYSMKTFSLGNWRGKTVALRFRATTKNKQPTSFSVDDVSLR